VNVEVPRDHPIFTNTTASSRISDQIELPVLTRKYPANKPWANNTGYQNNQPATFLHMNTDPDRLTTGWWGMPPMKWDKDVGSVLVVRADGKDLSPRQCEALCDFCQFKMQPMFGEFWESGGE